MDTKIMQALAIVAALLSGLITTAHANDPAITVKDGSVEVRIEGVASGKGMVYASIFLSAEGFPARKEAAYDYRGAPASNGVMVFTFDSVPEGDFVVAVLHDADSNQELTMNLLGMPEEAYGFSQNARAMFGPPKFDKAVVVMKAGQKKQLTVSLAKS